MHPLLIDLSQKIHECLVGYPEATVALSLKDSSNKLNWGINENRIFHAASLMKVPVMVEIFRLISEGRLSLEQELRIRNQFYSVIDHSTYSIEEDTDDHTYLRLGKTMSIADLMHQMIAVSSNIATNILLETIQIEQINATLRKMQVYNSKVLRGVEDLKAFEQHQNNIITASDIALVFEKILNGTCVSRFYDDMMIRILNGQQFNEMIPAELPNGTRVAHKTGDITRIHHDAGIIYPVNSPPYILALLIEGIENQVDSARLGARLSKVVYQSVRG